MRMFRPAAGLAAISACLLAASAVPAARGGPEVASIWDIQGATPWTEDHEVGDTETLIELPIHPRGLLRIGADVPGGPAGGPLLREGDLLYRVTVEGARLFCTVDAQEPIANEARFAHTILICLVDRNSDGTFEGYYRKGASKGVPLIFGTIPADLKPIGAVTYQEGAPASLGDAFTMRVKLDGDPAKAKKLRFVYEAGHGKNVLPLTVVTEVRNSSYPQVFEILGGLFELKGVKDGKAVIRMTSPTTLYPYMVEEGTVKT